MKGSRPTQAYLSAETDMTKTSETQKVIEEMVDGLNDHRIDDIGEFFSENFRWMGNQGCGTKKGLREFQENWQRPFQQAFSDKVCIDEARLFMGEWAAAFGRQEAIHSGEFMGIAATGKQVDRAAPTFSEQASEIEILDTGLKVADFICPYTSATLSITFASVVSWKK